MAMMQMKMMYVGIDHVCINNWKQMYSKLMAYARLTI